MDWLGKLLEGLFSAVSGWGSKKAEVPRDEIEAERRRVDEELREKHAERDSSSG